MRSRAEWGLRVLIIGVLGWYLLHILRVRRDGMADVATSATLASALARWSTVVAPPRVDVTLTHPPAGVERDWLAALSAVNTTVAWRGPTLVPTAIAASPRADPVWSATVSVAAPAGSDVLLTDTLGVIDSARAAGGEVLATVPHPRATLDARVGQVVARAALADSLALKRLLILGTASWETKFTVAALEERGWTVDARLGVSPQADVHDRTIAAIDTGRYTAVLALDSTAAPYAERIARYVGEGGGLVLWPGAASARALASLAPARLGVVLEDEGLTPSDTAPRAVLELVTLTGLAPDAVVVETRGPAAAVAARRAGLGRVIETGYTTLWRWRMAGGADAPDAHRAWLAGLVASVAYTDRVPRAPAPTDVAPLASLIDRVGPPSTTATPESVADPTRLAWGVFALLALALLAEWTSRRMRGVK